MKAAQAVTVALHHGVDEKGHWRKRLDVAIGEVHCSHAASFWSAYVQFCAPSVEVLQLSMNRNVHLWRKWPLLAKECDLVLTDRWMLLSKYQLKLFRYSAILLDAGGMHELAMSIGGVAARLPHPSGAAAVHPIAMRVDIPPISLTLCEAAEGQEADEERFGHHRHSEGLNERTYGERPALEKQRSAFEFHGPIRFHSPYPDSILSDVLKRVHSSSVSFVEPLLHALLQEREVLLGVVRRTRRQLTELHEMNARDETAHMLLALQLQHAALLREHRIASTAHLLPSDMVGAATRTAEVATQTEEDRRARFANLQDGRGVSGRGVSGRGDAASRNVSGRMGGSTRRHRPAVGRLAAFEAPSSSTCSLRRGCRCSLTRGPTARSLTRLRRRRRRRAAAAAARAAAAAACVSGAREAAGPAATPTAAPTSTTSRPPPRRSSCAASRARRNRSATSCARRSAFDTRRQVALQFLYVIAYISTPSIGSGATPTPSGNVTFDASKRARALPSLA